MQRIQNSPLLGRVKAGILSLLVFLILGLSFSVVLLKKDASSDLYFPLLIAASGVSGMFGGAYATRKERKNGLMNGAAASVLPIIAYLITVTVLQRGFTMSSLLPCAALFASSIAAGIAAANKKVKVKIKKRK